MNIFYGSLLALCLLLQGIGGKGGLGGKAGVGGGPSGGGGSCPGVGTPCLDGFVRANGALGANWTNSTGIFAGLTIVSNTVQQTTYTGHYALAAWTQSGSTFTADQYAQVHLVASNGDGVGVVLRWQDASNMYYARCYQSGSSACELNTVVAGTVTYIGSWSLPGVLANGDILRWTVIGTTFELFQNTVSAGTLTDSTFTGAGQPGVAATWVSGPSTLNNFQANNCPGSVCPSY